jgi:inhibitor of cysteine peptidase
MPGSNLQQKGIKMKYTFFVYCGIACIIAVACAGCTGPGPVNPAPPPSPQETATRVGNIVVDEQQNGATTSLDLSRTITLRLPENPSAGYVWDLMVTPGLKVTNDTFYPSDTSGSMVGAGGTRVWTITAMSPGEQKIQAIYKHPWEPVTGKENTFSMTIKVSPL